MTASAPSTMPSEDKYLSHQRRAAPALRRGNSEALRWQLVRDLQGSCRSLGKYDKEDDTQSVLSTHSTKSWWRRGKQPDKNESDKTTRSKKKPFIIRSLRWRKKKPSPRKQTNERVMDFVDVQSIASEPDFVGTKKLRLFERNSKKEQMETRSVASSRSFRGFVFHPKIASSTEDVVLDDADDDITLASGLIPDSEEDYSNSWSSHSSAEQAPPTLKRQSSILGRLLGKRKSKSSKTMPVMISNNEDTIGKEPFTSNLYTPNKTVRPTVEVSSTTANTTKARKESFVKRSLSSDDSSVSSDEQDEEISEIMTFRPIDARSQPALDRWSPCPSPTLESVSSTAPKCPRRQSPDSDDYYCCYYQDTTQPKKPDTRDVDEEESKTEDNNDADDNSVMSLLSGLLATWAAEREAKKARQQNARKGILKSSRGPVDLDKAHFSVTFDRIQIREYERTVGDNPACSSGCPISLGWSYVIAYESAIQDYERRRAPRRPKKEFHLSSGKRSQLLVDEWECPEEDIRKARREATYIQYCREKSVHSKMSRQNGALLYKTRARNKLPSPRPDQSDTSKPAMRPLECTPAHLRAEF